VCEGNSLPNEPHEYMTKDKCIGPPRGGPRCTLAELGAVSVSVWVYAEVEQTDNRLMLYVVDAASVIKRAAQIRMCCMSRDYTTVKRTVIATGN